MRCLGLVVALLPLAGRASLLLDDGNVVLAYSSLSTNSSICNSSQNLTQIGLLSSCRDAWWLETGPQYYNGSAHVTVGPAANMSLTFNGTYISVIGQSSLNGALVEAFIDNMSQGVINTSTASVSAVSSQIFFTLPDLAADVEHTLTLKFVDTNNNSDTSTSDTSTSDTSTSLTIDYFVINGTVLGTSTPSDVASTPVPSAPDLILPDAAPLDLFDQGMKLALLIQGGIGGSILFITAIVMALAVLRRRQGSPHLDQMWWRAVEDTQALIGPELGSRRSSVLSLDSSSPPSSTVSTPSAISSPISRRCCGDKSS